MPVVTIIWGGLLIGLGLWGYLGTGTTSVTALIPAFVGAPLAVCGALALKESLLKHAMHAAAMLGLLGTVGGIGNLIRVALDSTKSLSDPKTFHSVLSTAIMTGLCAVFVGLCINSFIQARRRRAARAQEGT
jgi:hypothetical protein